MSGIVCSCGKAMFDARGACTICLAQQEQQQQQRPTSPSSSPPSSLDQNMLAARPKSTSLLQHPAPSRRQMLPVRTRSTAEIIHSVFRTSDGGNEGSLFPDSFYDRAKPRKSSSGSSSTNSGTPSESSPPIGIPRSESIESDSSQPTRQSTPDSQRYARIPFDQAYSPMAASFASLSRKGDSTRSSSPRFRGSLELEAKMFQGPA